MCVCVVCDVCGTLYVWFVKSIAYGECVRMFKVCMCLYALNTLQQI